MFLSTAGRKLWIGLLVIGAIQLATLSNAFAQANGPTIFDVRRSLPLEPDEPVFHDFYIGAGPEAGFRKGMFVTVVRAIPVHDPVQNKQQATLNVTVGRLQVIHSERGVTVARLHSELTDEERPALEFEAVMIGDRVDLASLTMESPGEKKRARRKAAKSEAKIDVRVLPPADAVPTIPLAPPAFENPAPEPGADMKIEKDFSKGSPPVIVRASF